MKKKMHVIAGCLAFCLILAFWTSSVLVELFGTYDNITMVKNAILRGLFILIPCMVIVGASGASLGKKFKHKLVMAKKKKMPFIAINGVVILVPCAIFLQNRAMDGVFDTPFYAVQILELVAGAINLALMGANIRDGLALRRLKGNRAPKTT